MTHKSLKEYRIACGMELTKPQHTPTESIFTVSDLHLNHANIIKYCDRPFRQTDVIEMNRVLIKNWNYVVKPNDLVFFVGDMSLGLSDRFIEKLNGNIKFVIGNHDRTSDPDSVHGSICYTYKDVDFLFVHNPKDVPSGFEGWVIHGHHHNNYPDTFPFFDYMNRKVNVSVELVKYKPVPLDYIYTLIQNNPTNITQLE